MTTDTLDAPTTLKAYLKPIDSQGLAAFAAKGCANPASRGTNKVKTVMQGMYRSLSYVGNHAPVVVDEPLHLFGEDTAPAPGEIVLSGLGGCLAVGITAVATWKKVQLTKLEIFMEGDIGNPAAWGAGGAPKLAPLITAIGMSILLQTIAMVIWKPNYKSFPTLLPSDPLPIGGAVITPTQILILAVTAIALALLMWLVNGTRLGRAMRATAENPRVATLMGVKPDMVISATFVIGAVLAALAGVMWASNYGTVQHGMGFLPGLKAFTAAVFGGIGNLAGAVVGGILLGLIEAIASGYIGDLTGGVLGSHYADIFAFVVLIIMLTLRPSGLLGERVADRA